MDLIFPLKPGKNCEIWAFVGSRVTCDPSPTDTDRDVLVLCAGGELADLAARIEKAGGGLCGESYGDQDTLLYPYRLGVDNYLLTEDRDYFYRFLAVTRFAQKQNIMDKAVRKELFAAAMDAMADMMPSQVNSAPLDSEDFF